MKLPPVYYFLFLMAALLNLGPIILNFYWPAENGVDVTGHPIGRDFINLWVGPQLAFSGRLQILFDLDGYHQAISELFGTPLPFHNWGAPPFMLILLWPFSQMPYFVALASWTLLTLALYLVAALSALDRSRWLEGVILLSLSPAALINVIGGQNGFLTAALFIGGFLALDRRPYLAGVFFGILTVKPHLGLIVPVVLLRGRAWRTIMAAICTTCLLVLASIAALGLEPWRVFLTATRAYQTLLLIKFDGFYTYMMSSIFAAVRSMGGATYWASTIQAIIAIPVAFVTFFAWGKARDRILKVQLVVSAAALMTPYLFTYDLTALSVVVVWRLLEPGGMKPFERFLYILAWLSPSLAFNMNMSGLPVAPLVPAAVFLAALRDIRAGGLQAPSARGQVGQFSTAT